MSDVLPAPLRYLAEEVKLRAQNAEMLKALQTIAGYSKDAEDPCLSSESSWGNYDDVFSDGCRQADYETAVFARAVIARVMQS